MGQGRWEEQREDYDCPLRVEIKHHPLMADKRAG
jgi:hypothetical protein